MSPRLSPRSSPRSKVFTEEQLGLPLVRALHRARPQDRSVILKHLDDKGVDSYSSHIYNLAHSRIPMKIQAKKKLNRLFTDHTRDFKKIFRKDISPLQRRKLLTLQNQNGGALSSIIKTALPYVSALVKESQTQSGSDSKTTTPMTTSMKKVTKLKGASINGKKN